MTADLKDINKDKEKDRQAISQAKNEILTLKTNLDKNKSDYNARLKKMEAENKATLDAMKKLNEEQNSSLNKKVAQLQKEFSSLK